MSGAVHRLADGRLSCGGFYTLPPDEGPDQPFTGRGDEAWPEIRSRIFDRDCGVCHVCGQEIDREYYECGHIVDRAAGGSDRDHNLVAMCNVCNRAKPIHETREEYLAWVRDYVPPWKRSWEEWFRR